MALRKQSRGNCGFCGQDMSKGGLSKHLSSCGKRLDIINVANSKSGQEEVFYHLRIEGASQSRYWLHLEMDGNATMKKLDSYLRAIWLECCGHLSEFSIGKWTEKKIAMSRKAGQVFSVGMEIHHIYDFGSTSVTKIKVVDMRKGKSISEHPITLMARNDPPDFLCIECGEPASWLCIECLCEDDEDESGALCDKHAKGHPHRDYGAPMPLVNSPRVGMCGYDGPAEPPY
jgi:hypothetical protein